MVFLGVQTNYGEGGMISDRYNNFILERAKGGAGLIIVGLLSPIKSLPSPATHGIEDGRYIPRLRDMVDAVHSYNAKIAGQISPSYYFAKDASTSPELVGPSEHINVVVNQTARALTIEEVHQLVRDCAEAAQRCQEAGFDAVEFQAGMGYLLNRFLSPVTNKRTDEYGGNVDNRMRIVLEIVESTRRKVGRDYPILCRFSADEFMEGGLTINDWKIMAPLLERAGIDIMNVEAGWHECRTPLNQASVPQGAFVYLAKEIKSVVKTPVIGAYRINNPLLAEQILAEGKTDLIGIARALIADPEFCNKAKEGRFDEIRPCMACNHCVGVVMGERYEGGPLECAVNPKVGKEKETTLKPATKSKKVLVIGGGPAGMQAAMTAASKGHDVTLYDRGDKLGGQLLTASLPPYKDEIKRLTNALAAQVKEAGVKVELNAQVDVPFILENKPDTVIVATGAKPFAPDIPGVKGKNVVTAIEALTETTRVGNKVVVIGGGLVGCETAESLAEKGKEVTILEMLKRMATDIPRASRWVLMQRLRKANIVMETDLRVEEITVTGVKGMREGNPIFYPADTVVLATGSLSDKDMAIQLQNKVPEIHLIGDCAEPRKIKEAIEEGFSAGSLV